MDDKNNLLDDDLDFEEYIPQAPSNKEEIKQENNSMDNVIPIENIFSLSSDKKEYDESNDIKIEEINNITINNDGKDKIIENDTKESIIPVEEILSTSIEANNLKNNDNNVFTIEEDSISSKDSISENVSKDKSDNKKNDVKNHIENISNIIKGHARVLPVIAFLFVSILGVYIFINNVGADEINLIKIEEKQKVGYINNNGSVIIKPKYLYGTDYYNGYAVVKNYNNLYGVIDGKGNSEIAFGNIFSANLYSDRYIVSKFTNNGLKMGLLDSNLKEVTRFKYDNLSYSKSGVFLYTDNDTMGIVNTDGKEIYSYKVDEIDDRNISIEVSNLDDKSSSDVYAKIKVNESSTIINTKTGKEVYKYTLDDIRVLDNNVFYVKNKNGNNKYFVIKNDKIVYETNEYKRIRVEDLSSDIAIAIKEDASIDYINLATKEKINKDGNIKYTYSDGVILEKTYNFQTNKDEYTIITPNKVLGSFSDIKTVEDKYVNDYMKVYTKNNKFSFIDKKGNLITNKEYEEVSDFNKNGYAVVSNDNSYGVINSSGKEIVSLKYDEIVLLDDTLFSNIKKLTNEELFIFKTKNKYGIINATGKELVKPIYDNFELITTKYPIMKVKYNNEFMLLNLETYKDLSIDVSDDIQIYSDYILNNNDYYNYNGQLIYSIGG